MELRHSGAAVGSWIKLPSAMSVEVLFEAGADFICIDMCNGWFSLERVNELLAHRGARGPRLVRLAGDAAPSVVGQLLDAGADGVVVAHVESLQKAREMVAGAFFGPVGSRGMGSTGRAGRWGLAPHPQYLTGGEPGPTQVSITLMIESAKALAMVDELASIRGVTQLLIGTADLGADLNRDPARLAEAIVTVLDSCSRHVVTPAIATGSAAEAAAYIAQGFAAVFVSNDLTLLGRSAQRCFSEIRESAEAGSPDQVGSP